MEWLNLTLIDADSKNGIGILHYFCIFMNFRFLKNQLFSYKRGNKCFLDQRDLQNDINIFQ